MKSPLELAARCLRDMEYRWIPYSSLWWRYWTPSIGRGERYQEGYFDGYGGDDDSDGEMPPLDIRRMLAMPFVRRIYKKMPYIDVVPVKRPWEDMSEEQRQQREEFVIESTMAAYNSGKALYPRETIHQIEEQMDAAEQRARKPVRRLFARCEAPQTAWVKFTDLDGVVRHIATWVPGAAMVMSDGDVYRSGRSQIEFRTIQELTMPDPDNETEQFVPDQWQQSIAYNPITIVRRAHIDDMLTTYSADDEHMTVGQMQDRLAANRQLIGESPEWKTILESLAVTPRRSLERIDKIVFVYSSGMSDDCEFCKRSMLMFALVTRLRDLVSQSIPIYMPAYDIIRKWNDAESEFLRQNGVTFVKSNGRLFLKVDERTAVVSFRNWNPVKQVVADLAKPAVLVCTPVSEDSEQDFAYNVEERDGERVRIPKIRARDLGAVAMLGDPDSPRVRKLVEDYDRFELPRLPGAISDTVEKGILSFYLRRDDVSTKVEYQ
ncbi:hypothetical protein MFIFM68171_08464 [Madurella fahalii]|uniref:Uncharacterized protein n=1 Tax=Madurella fahalii TaxID=1157608 RepID=A0ABQ0GKN2_9PEZI